jgi:hypothetical protein
MTPCVHGVRYPLPYRVDARDRGPQRSVVFDEEWDMEAVAAEPRHGRHGYAIGVEPADLDWEKCLVMAPNPSALSSGAP